MKTFREQQQRGGEERIRRMNNDTSSRSITPPPLPPRSIPPFRSVSMSVMTPSSPSILFQQPQQHHLLGNATMKNSHFSAKQTAPPKSHSYPISKKASPKEQALFVWKLQQVKPVPLYHPLEPTAITICDQSIDVITKRISNFMKIHSIHCTYQDDLSRVDCSTDELLHFVVQLWKKDSSGGYVIEIQRRQGCSISMQTLRQALIQSIKHEQDQEEATSSYAAAYCPQASSLVEEMASAPASAYRTETRGDCLEQCMEICQQLLKSDLLDQNRLGLESLLCLTDPTKVLFQSAVSSCSQIISSDVWQSLLIRFFFSGHHETDLQLLALKAMTFALESCVYQKHHHQQAPKLDKNSAFWKTLLAVYHQNIRSAATKPIEASLSIKSLRLLQTIEPEFLSSFPQQQLEQCLQTAHDFGKQHSRSLEKEADLLSMMEPAY